MMRVQAVRVLGAVIAIGVLACNGRADRQRESTSGAIAATLVMTLTPIAWLAQGEQILFKRVDRWTSGDVGEVSCDSSGFYELDQQRIRPLAVGATACQVVSRMDDASPGPHGRFLLYADVFEQGRIFRVDLQDLSKEEVLRECLPANSAPALSHDGRSIAYVASCEDAVNADLNCTLSPTRIAHSGGRPAQT